MTQHPRQVLSSDTARRELQLGVNILADAVSATLGPRGRNVVLPGAYPGATPLTTKDGVTVAKAIDLADPAQQAGVLLIRGVASKTVDAAGDGTTTAVVLARAIYSEGMRLVAAGSNPTSLKRGIDRAVTLIIGQRDADNLPQGGLLSALSSPVSGDMIAQVGTISANGDPEIGDTLAEAMSRVGLTGVVTVEESKSMETTLEVVEGMQFDRGYLSPYFVTDAERMEAVYDSPAILLFAKKLSGMKTAQELAEFVAQQVHVPQPRPLLLIAEDVEPDVLAFLVINKVRGTLPVVAVKSPGFGDRKQAMLADLAALTGATVLGDELGITLKEARRDILGSAVRVTVDKDSCTISSGGGDPDRLAARIAEIRQQIDKAESDYDREKLSERLAKLTGGVAVIKVGAATETEMKEKKARVEDAMHATRAAVAEGIVPGGGVALLRVAASPEFAQFVSSLTDTDERAGATILQRACSAPLRQIVKNAGGDESEVVGIVLHPERFGQVNSDPKLADLEEFHKRLPWPQPEGYVPTAQDYQPLLVPLSNPANFGYNAATGQYEDLVAAGVLDPTKVTRTALQSAASIAGLMLTTEAVVVDDTAALKELAAMRGAGSGGPGGGMPGMSY